MKRLVLVDGNALLHRAYHATPPLTTSKGELVNAVYGFTLMLLKSLQDLKPDFVALTWDVKDPTFRHQAYTQYKATRGPADEGLRSQYERVYQVVQSLNIPEFRLSGFEADDLIGTLARQAVEKEKNLEVIVLTGDRDIMQIIADRVKVLMPRKTISDIGLYDEAGFREKWGFEPPLLVDYKGLAGDASDNIPGVPGIGDVTAKKLITQFETIEQIYQPENLKTLPARTQKLLAEGAESAVMSKQLATLDLNVPIKLDLAACVVQDFDRETVAKLFEELEFKSLLGRLPKGEDSVIPAKAGIPNPEDPRLRKDDESSSRPNQTSLGLEFEDKVSFETTQSKEIIELDLAVEKVLQKMSANGVMIDLESLNTLGDSLKKRLIQIEKEIFASVGHEFNLNSPKQLGEVLFDELELPVVRKTKTGRSTDEGVLQELKGVHPAIELLLEYRQLYKLVSTYVDSLPKYIGEDKRVHSTFNVEGAASGRLSSQNPNLQNIPIRGELGVEIRKAFVAPEGKVLLGADYSQIELRIMAHLADDPGLRHAFQSNLDIHAATGAKIFEIPIDQVNREQRSIGKTMNFATLYGQGPRALSKLLGISVETAKQYIEDYFNEFPKVREWKEQTLRQAYEQGYVETISGRKRFIPELQASNKAIQSFGERAAINHPVQGSSADMIKKAMVEIDKQLNSHCQMILQIHDELLFECDKNSVEESAKKIKQLMEQALVLSVPVNVDLKVGENWGSMQPLTVD